MAMHRTLSYLYTACARSCQCYVCAWLRVASGGAVRSQLQRRACATTARKICGVPFIGMWRSSARARDRWRVAGCAREVSSARGGVADALARRGLRAAIYIRAARLAHQ